MLRRRRVDYDRVVTNAMHRFWRHGYWGTSMKDLLDSIGVGRGSLYSTLRSSKRGLFERALELYLGQTREGLAQVAEGSASPRRTIAQMFETAVDVAVESGSRDGCFLVNTALDVAPHDRHVAGMVGRAFQEIEDTFRILVERGQAAGEIPRDADAGRIARALLSLMITLRVFSRSRPEESVLRTIQDDAEALLT